MGDRCFSLEPGRRKRRGWGGGGDLRRSSLRSRLGVRTRAIWSQLEQRSSEPRALFTEQRAAVSEALQPPPPVAVGKREA